MNLLLMKKTGVVTLSIVISVRMLGGVMKPHPQNFHCVLRVCAAMPPLAVRSRSVPVNKYLCFDRV